MTDPETTSFFNNMIKLGYCHADFRSNGILLPNTRADSERFGLPYHSGSHPKYTRHIWAALRILTAQFDLNNHPDQVYAALCYLRLFQGRVRISMAQGRGISINEIKVKPKFKRSPSMERAIDTRDFLEFDPIGRCNVSPL